MNVSLTIPERLKDLRNERGLDIADVANATGISSSALSNYENDESKDISHRAIIALARFYDVSADYLLGLTEIKNRPNAALHELHLSEDVIELLKSGRINNRLLCEFAGHEGFQRLMVDMEVYVDRIASMRINDLNTLLAAERKLVMEKMNLDGNDANMRALELAQIDGDKYFAHVIYDDLRPILRDIREAHETDTTTADTDSPAADAIRQIESVVNSEGSPQEKQIRLLLSQLGIDYDTLTADEFVTLIGILNKSKLLNDRSSRRGKGSLTHGQGKRKKKK